MNPLHYIYLLRYKLFKIKKNVYFIFDTRLSEDFTKYKGCKIYTTNRNKLFIDKDSEVIGGVENFVYKVDKDITVCYNKEWKLLKYFHYIFKILKIVFYCTLMYFVLKFFLFFVALLFFFMSLIVLKDNIFIRLIEMINNDKYRDKILKFIR